MLYLMMVGTASTGEKGTPMDKSECIALSVHHGDEGAVERLVRAYQDQLYGYALRMLRNPFDAEEVTQDVFIRACRTLALSYGPERCRQIDMRPWLFRITRNLALNRVRDRRSSGRGCLSAIESPIAPPAPQDAGTGEPLERLVDQDAVRRALGRLEWESRELVVLRFIEGLSYDEIAKTTGSSAAAARGKVFRALRRLRSLLTKGGSRCDVKR